MGYRWGGGRCPVASCTSLGNLLQVFLTVNPLFIPIEFPGVLGKAFTIGDHLSHEFRAATISHCPQPVEKPLHIFLGTVKLRLDSSELTGRWLRLTLTLSNRLLDHLKVGHNDDVPLEDSDCFHGGLTHVWSEV